MESDLFEVKIKGKAIKVPSTRINDKTVVVTGKWIRIAAVHDEDWLEGQVVDAPELFVTELKASKVRADVFTFAQKIPDVKPKYKYPMEWDNVAAIPIPSFRDWWERVSSDMRKDVKRADKREVIVKAVEFNDELVRGVIGIHNDTPIRQGGRFSHYGKLFDAVKREYGTYLERSEFIAAYYKDELIGLIKMVYVGELACFMQILTKTSHYDKRPTNALVAKSVEVSEKKGKSYVTYGKYYYGNKKKSSLVDFKHRNGFERILFPRYYIPLTFKGKLIVKLNLHLGLLGILPGNLISLLVYLRSILNQRILLRWKSPGGIGKTSQDDELDDGKE
jgi:hypothetical protein